MLQAKLAITKTTETTLSYMLHKASSKMTKLFCHYTWSQKIYYIPTHLETASQIEFPPQTEMFYLNHFTDLYIKG